MGVAIVNALSEAGIDLVASLPEGRTAGLIEAIASDERFVHVELTREDEGVAVCSGAWFGGRRACLFVQNAGLLKSVCELAKLSLFAQIPLLMLVMYRGDLGEPHWYHGTVGRVTVPVLDALGVKHFSLDGGRDAARVVCGARQLAEVNGQPVAVLLSQRAVEAP